VHSKSVVLNGHILRLGAFNDVVSNTRERESVRIGFSMSPLQEEDTISRNVRMHSGVYGYYGHAMGPNVKAIELSFEFNTEGNSRERELLQLQPQLAQSRIKVRLRENQESQDDEFHITRSMLPVEQRATSLKLNEPNSPTIDLDSLRYEVLKPENLRAGRRYSGFGLPISGKSAGAILNHFLPLRLSIVFDVVEEQARGILGALINPREGRHTERDFATEWETSISIQFRTTLLDVLRDCLASIKQQELFQARIAAVMQQFEKEFTLKNYLQLTSALPPQVRRLLADKITEKTSTLKEAIKAGRKPQFVLAYAPLPEFLDYAVDYIRNYFTLNLKYLGPLRDEPKPVYPLSGTTDPRDVGFRGEHTAAVLDVHKNTPVTYIPSDSFKVPGAISEQKSVSLLAAVSDWLSYMGVVQNLKTTDMGKLGHELKVATTGSGELHELTHVGVGVSQVLPILVLSLLAEPDSTLIFEQPELHLHPRVQTRLAEFFVAMSMLGKQCIVETHSEYLINRLRYLSAVSEGKAIADRVILYFVEKEAGHSRYRPIRINEFGVIPDWPKGFFDENEENAAATLKAAMAKRRRNSSKKNVPPIS
jgi:predicted ATPase